MELIDQFDVKQIEKNVKNHLKEQMYQTLFQNHQTKKMKLCLLKVHQQ